MNTTPLLRIQRAPGDFPRAVEQLNGDLLIPEAARPLLERALLLAEDALMADQRREMEALQDARHVLGVERLSRRRDPVAANLLKVRAI